MDLNAPDDLMEMSDAAGYAYCGSLLAVWRALDSPETRKASKELLQDVGEDEDYDASVCDLVALDKALMEDDIAWRAQLQEVFERCAPVERRLTLSSLATEDYLTAGVAQRRFDAVLDLAAVPFSAGDIQADFVGAACGLAENKLTWGNVATTWAACGALGFAGGFFGMGLGAGAGVKVAQYYSERLTQVDETAEAAAKLLVSVDAVLAGEDADFDYVGRVWLHLLDWLADAYGRSGEARRKGYDHRQQDKPMLIVEGAARLLQGLLEEQQRRPQAAIPDVRGWNALAADWYLESLGCTVKHEDALSSRWLVEKTNWRVVEQRPAAGAAAGRHVTVCSKKWTE